MDTMLISGNTDPGKRRNENQDAYTFRQLWSAGKALLLVVDGVGGYAGGEKAAAIARDSIGQYMQMPRGNTITMLREAVVFANNRIVAERKEDQYLSEMCCVLTAVVADATVQSLYYVHVGDTRLYRYRNGYLQKITKDHSFVGIREDAGEISEHEAMQHPLRHQILREVGSDLHRLDDEDFMDYGREDLQPGDTWLLCSDGLSDMITAQQMTKLLSTDQSPDDKVNSLIALANEMGGNDNITVVLLQYPAAGPAQEQDIVETPVPMQQEERVTAPVAAKKQRQMETSRLLWAVLLLLLIAAAGWYLSPSKNAVVPASIRPQPDTIVARVVPEEQQNMPTGRITHPAVPGPGMERKTDTLRLTTTRELKDLQRYADSTNSNILLLPAKNNQKRFPAVEITGRSAKLGDTLLLRNLRIKDFETGVHIQVPVQLRTENLVFDNTRYPFSYGYKPDSAHRSVLIINSAKQ